MDSLKYYANKMQLSVDTCIIVLLGCLIRGLSGLRMIKVSIPAYKLRGESAFLECQYELSRHKDVNLHSTDRDGAKKANFEVNYSDADEMPSTYTRTRNYPYQNRQQQHYQRRQQIKQQHKRFANGGNLPHYQYQQQYQQHTHQYQQYSQQHQQQLEQEQEQQSHQQYDQQQQQYERPHQTQLSPYGHSIYRGRSPTYSVNFGARPGMRTHTDDSRERADSVEDSQHTDEEEEEDEGEALYAIKWYKDNEEFYRYVPKADPPKTSYRVDGVRVIEEHSDSSRVLLRGLTLNSTGLYRCEISAEAPNFSSVIGEGRMDIVFLPRDGPHIKGQQFQYQTGETLSLNCSSGKSHPASHLQWFINEQPITDKRYLIHYNNTVHKHGLITSTLGLELAVDSRHFQNGAMRVKCLASISPVLWKGGKESVLQRRPGIIDNREAMLLVRSSCPRLYPKHFQHGLVLLIFYLTLIKICQLQEK